MRRTLLILVAALAALACKRLDEASPDLGGRCAIDDECSVRCLPEPRWPQGFCSRDCDAAEDCPVGAECVDREVDGAVCLFACLDDRDCDFLESSRLDDAWRCERDGARPVRVCVPQPSEADLP